MSARPRRVATGRATCVRRGVGFVVAVAVLMAGAIACEPAELNEWLAANGKPTLVEPELSRSAAAITEFWAGVKRDVDHRNAFTVTLTGVDAARLGLSWRPGCPLAPTELRLITVSYWGYDNAAHTGELIVNRTISLQTIAALREMWNAKFPIKQMVTAEKFVGPEDFRPDGTFIETNEPDVDNNTSSFFCRAATGNNNWSQHAFGLAIDINPIENPYIKGSTVVPPNGVRDPARPGTITAGSVPVAAMKRAGLIWGGTWTSLKDYMHFSKSGR